MQTDDAPATAVDRDDIERLAVCWQVLGGLLKGPITAGTLGSVTSDPLLDEWPLPPGPRTAEGLRAWRDCRSVGEDVEAVEADRRRLVDGPGHVPASPYESVHRSREGLLFEDETLQVRDWYRRYGLRVPRLNRDPDDHACLELEFLTTLLRRAATVWDEGDRASAAGLVAAHDLFLTEHPGAWFPQFFALLEEHAATRFLRGLGILGQEVTARALATASAGATNRA